MCELLIIVAGIPLEKALAFFISFLMVHLGHRFVPH